MKHLSQLLLLQCALLLGGCAAFDRAELRVRSAGEEYQAANPDLERARYLILQREYGLAITEFRKVLRFDPKNAEAYNGLGVAYRGVGRADLARRNFEIALAHKPAEGKFYRNLSKLLKAEGEHDMARRLKEDFELAVQSIDNAAETGDKTELALSSDPETPISDTKHAAQLSLPVQAAAEKPEPDQPEKKEDTRILAVAPRNDSLVAREMIERALKSLGNESDGGDPKQSSSDRMDNAKDLERLYLVLADLYQGIGEPLFAQAHLDEADAIRAAAERRHSNFAAAVPMTTSGVPFLHRISLGEVKLVTQPIEVASIPMRKAGSPAVSMFAPRSPGSLQMDGSIALAAALEELSVPVPLKRVIRPSVDDEIGALLALEDAMEQFRSARIAKGRLEHHTPSNDLQAIAVELYDIASNELREQRGKQKSSQLAVAASVTFGLSFAAAMPSACRA